VGLLLSERLVFGENPLAVVELRLNAAQPEQTFIASLVERRVVTFRLQRTRVRAETRGLEVLNLEFKNLPQATKQTEDLLRFAGKGIGDGAFRGHEP